MKRGFEGRREGKEKGGEGSGGRRFFKQRKGTSNLADDNTDAWQAEGPWHDVQWQDSSWDDWSWDYSEESYAARGKGQGKYRKDGKDGKSGSKDGAAQLADAAQSSTLTTAATTFFVDHSSFFDLCFMATEVNESFIAQPLRLRPRWCGIWDAPGR